MANPRKPRPKPSPALRDFDLQVEAFLSAFLLREGYSPSHRKIAEGLGKQLLSVQLSLKKLIAHGRVRTTLKNGKGLEVVSGSDPTPAIPLLGVVAAGQPIEAVEGSDRQTIGVPPWMMRPGQNYFVLRVAGESMIEDQILDGDLVLIRQSAVARNGDRVVALIDNEATLKRFEKRGTKIFLHPANAAMSPIEISANEGENPDFRIAGIFSGILRRVDG